jgi:hypothetical protein
MSKQIIAKDVIHITFASHFDTNDIFVSGSGVHSQQNFPSIINELYTVMSTRNFSLGFDFLFTLLYLKKFWIIKIKS